MMNRWTWLFVTLLIAGPLWLWASRVPLDAQPLNLSPEPALGRPAPDLLIAAPFFRSSPGGR